MANSLSETFMYILKLVGIKCLRGIVGLFHTIGPALSSSPPLPKPTRSVTLPWTRRGSQGSKIRFDVWLPSSSQATSASSSISDGPQKGVWPIIVNLHGSGFCCPSQGSDARFLRHIADSVGAVVLDVDYRHAPEDPYPAALDDVDSFVQWVRAGGYLKAPTLTKQQKGKLPLDLDRWDRTRLAITGFSSGGNLALTACVRLYASGGESQLPKAVVAFYPSTNLAESPYDKPNVKPTATKPGKVGKPAGGVIPPYVRQLFYASYLPPHVSRKDPQVSPLYADQAAFPASTTLITCEGDSLAREGVQMYEHLQRGPHGKQVAHLQVPGQGHGWDQATKPGTHADELRQQSYDLAAERIREAFASAAST